MKFWEWSKSDKLQIDNEKATDDEIRQKFIEEATETVEAFYYFYDDPKVKNLINLLGEVMDLIQVSINIIRRCKKISKNNGIDYTECVSEAYIKHNEKRIARGWELDEREEFEIGFKTKNIH